MQTGEGVQRFGFDRRSNDEANGPLILARLSVPVIARAFDRAASAAIRQVRRHPGPPKTLVPVNLVRTPGPWADRCHDPSDGLGKWRARLPPWRKMFLTPAEARDPNDSGGTGPDYITARRHVVEDHGVFLGIL